MVGESPRLLILGSLPGEESLRRAQYYAHKNNAFWRIMGELCGFDPALEYDGRIEALKRAGVALWDVAAEGSREGSLDSDLTLHRANSVAELVRSHPTIRRIGCNGSKAYELLRKSAPELFETLEVVKLPSTSPAAAMLRYEQKLERWNAFYSLQR